MTSAGRRGPIPGEPDGFEGPRQIQETKNEVFIASVLGALFFALFLAHVLTHAVSWAPYRAPLGLIALFGVSAVGSLAFALALHGARPYHPLRKYAVTAVHFAVFTASFVMSGEILPKLFLTAFPVAVFALLVASSGLRYDAGVVVFSGLQAVAYHWIFFAPLAPPSFRPAVVVGGGLIPLAATAVTAHIVTSLMRLHRESVWKERLSRFVAPELVEEIARKPEILTQQTERRVASVLFTDIRGFTTLSEKMPPEEVVRFLNLYLEEMTQAILEQKGMLDKYIGDAVMGVFGVPFGDAGHALRAVKTALAMVERLRSLNATLARRGLPPLSIGVGIHTGEVVVGAIGSSKRLDYTVIGDTVNVASRIEALTRKYPVDILLSDTTREDLGDAMPLREIATIQVRNREKPVTVWTPEQA